MSDVPVGRGVAGEGPQDRGARVLDVLHARPLHRHPARADGRRSRWRPRRRPPCGSARSCSTTTTSTRRSSPRRRRRSTCCRTGRVELGIGARVDAGRLRRARPAVRLRRRAHRPARGGARSDQGLLRRRAVQLLGRRTTRSPTTTAIPKPVQQPLADPDRRWRAQGADARRPRGRHRRHQPEPARRASSSSTRPPTPSPSRPSGRSSGSRKARAIASTTSSSRSATSSPPSPTTGRRSPRPRRPRSGSRADEALGSGVALLGTVDEICDTLVERRERWGVSYVVIGDDQVEAFAPVVARLAGT